jgi:hypothetical protein
LKTGIVEKGKSFGCGTYHHVAANIMPRKVKLLDGAFKPAQVLG